MTETTAASEPLHLFDPTLGGMHAQGACGAATDNPLSPEKFRAAESVARCPACIKELAELQAYELTCRICRETFNTSDEASRHEYEEHVLTVVSYRKEPICFVLNVQECYDSPNSVARMLTRARRELKYLSVIQWGTPDYEFVPASMMLTRKSENSVLLGKSHVTHYAVVPR